MSINRSTLQTLIESNIFDNHVNAITPALLREVLTAVNDSDLNLISDTSILGLSDWNAGLQYSSSGTLVYENVIYRALVSTTVGTFIPSEYSVLSTFINSTSGLSIYLEKDNGIELDDSKYIKTITADATISTAVTGLYIVQNISQPTGPTQQYPVSGKAILTMLRRSSTAESLMIYYPLADLTHYYIRTLTGNWSEFKSQINYTFTNGIQNNSNVISIGGNFSDIYLTGNSFNINGNLNIQGTSGLSTLNQIGIFKLGIGTDSIDNLSSSININTINTNINSNVNISNSLNIGSPAAYTQDNFISGILNRQIPDWQTVQNYTLNVLGSTSGMVFTNGLTNGTNGTGQPTIEQGGSLTKNTTINANSFNYNFSNINNYSIHSNNSTSSSVNTFISSTVDTRIYGDTSLELLSNNGGIYGVSLEGGVITLDSSSGTVNIGDQNSLSLTNFNSNSILTNLAAEAQGYLSITNGASQTISIDWVNTIMYDTSNTNSLNWSSRDLIDTSFQSSINWGNRNLLDTNGGIVLNWSTPGVVEIGAPNIIGLTSLSFGSTSGDGSIHFKIDGISDKVVFDEIGRFIFNTTNGYLLPPRMTTTQKNAISAPIKGALIYDTTLDQLQVYNGSWTNL